MSFIIVCGYSTIKLCCCYSLFEIGKFGSPDVCFLKELLPCLFEPGYNGVLMGNVFELSQVYKQTLTLFKGKLKTILTPPTFSKDS